LWENDNQISPNIVKIDILEPRLIYSSSQSSLYLWDNIRHIQANNYKTFLENFTLPDNTPLLHPIYARDPNVLVKK
jgi:hypothetical protein